MIYSIINEYYTLLKKSGDILKYSSPEYHPRHKKLKGWQKNRK
jgi:hypothetical protein